MFGNRYAQNQRITLPELARSERYQDSHSAFGYFQQIQEDIRRAAF